MLGGRRCRRPAPPVAEVPGTGGGMLEAHEARCPRGHLPPMERLPPSTFLLWSGCHFLRPRSCSCHEAGRSVSACRNIPAPAPPPSTLPDEQVLRRTPCSPGGGDRRAPACAMRGYAMLCRAPACASVSSDRRPSHSTAQHKGSLDSHVSRLICHAVLCYGAADWLAPRSAATHAS